MEWLTYLMLLLCPLMMIFMMKGHGGGHKNHASNDSKELDAKISSIKLENDKLRKEIKEISNIIKS